MTGIFLIVLAFICICVAYILTVWIIEVTTLELELSTRVTSAYANPPLASPQDGRVYAERHCNAIADGSGGDYMCGHDPARIRTPDSVHCGAHQLCQQGVGGGLDLARAA